MSTDKYGDDYRYANSASSETATATWRPDIGKAGYYDVFVWYPQGSNRTTAAPYRVLYNGGTATATLNQVSGGGTWNKIASSKLFLVGTAGCVVLGNSTGESSKVVMADAAQFQLVLALDVTPPTINVIARTPMAPIGGHLAITVDASDNVGVTGVTVNGIALTKGVGQSVDRHHHG